MTKVRPVRWRRGILALALLTPVLTALMAILALGTPKTDSVTGQPDLKAAVVNEDKFVEQTINGQQVPVAVGRMLIGQLATSSTDGFDWVITDSQVAQDGLDSGEFAAVVTIPENFSQSYLSSTTTDPVQAQLTIETDGSHSYLAAVLARSMAVTIQSQLSNQLTSNFIDQLLVGYTTMSTGIAEAASGASQLASGLGEISTLSSALPAATSELASGAAGVNWGVQNLAKALGDLGAWSQSGVENAAELESDLQTLYNWVNTNISASDPNKASLLSQLNTLISQAGTVTDETTASDLGIDAGAIAADIIGDGSSLVSSGAKELASGMPLLSDGLSGASSGASALASGLSSVSSEIPSYSPEQAQQLADVVSNPIAVDATADPKLPTIMGAVGAFAVPIALWLGALVLALVYQPFERKALASRATNARIVWGASLPPILMAVIQAGLVLLGVWGLGLNPVHHLSLVGLILVSAVSFVLLHQGFAALTGRFAWLLSIALLGLQVVAAGVVIPSFYLPGWAHTAGAILPLSQSIEGAQELITGGSMTHAAGTVVWLIASAFLGLILLAIAVMRGRKLKPQAS